MYLEVSSFPGRAQATLGNLLSGRRRLDRNVAGQRGGKSSLSRLGEHALMSLLRETFHLEARSLFCKTTFSVMKKEYSRLYIGHPVDRILDIMVGYERNDRAIGVVICGYSVMQVSENEASVGPEQSQLQKAFLSPSQGQLSVVPGHSSYCRSQCVCRMGFLFFPCKLLVGCTWT